MAKVTIDNLAQVVQDILDDYEGEVEDKMDEIVRRVGKAGVSALKSSSKANFRGSGKYASGWTSQVEKNRYGTTVTIYNKYPGLPHLLENGHAKRGGGRVQGRVHIAPVEEKVVDEFIEGVEKL